MDNKVTCFCRLDFGEPIRGLTFSGMDISFLLCATRPSLYIRLVTYYAAVPNEWLAFTNFRFTDLAFVGSRSCTKGSCSNLHQGRFKMYVSDSSPNNGSSRDRFLVGGHPKIWRTSLAHVSSHLLCRNTANSQPYREHFLVPI